MLQAQLKSHHITFPFSIDEMGRGSPKYQRSFGERADPPSKNKGVPKIDSSYMIHFLNQHFGFSLLFFFF